MKDDEKIDIGKETKISNVLLVEDSPGDVRLTQPFRSFPRRQSFRFICMWPT